MHHFSMTKRRPPTEEEISRGQRIAHLRGLLGIEQDDLSSMLGLSRGAVGNWELGGGISRKNLEQLIDDTGVDYAWLTKGSGQAPSALGDLNVSMRLYSMLPGIRGKVVYNSPSGFVVVSEGLPYEGTLPNALPEIDISAGAGPGGYADVQASGKPMLNGDSVRGEYVLPDYFLRELTQAHPQSVHVVPVRGDSMEETLRSGDRVFVDTSDRTIGQGGVFVLVDLTSNDEVLVKRLRRAGNGSDRRVEIVSDNPKEGPPRLIDGQDIRVIGRAVGRLTRI